MRTYYRLHIFIVGNNSWLRETPIQRRYQMTVLLKHEKLRQLPPRLSEPFQALLIIWWCTWEETGKKRGKTDQRYWKSPTYCVIFWMIRAMHEKKRVKPAKTESRTAKPHQITKNRRKRAKATGDTRNGNQIKAHNLSSLAKRTTEAEAKMSMIKGPIIENNVSTNTSLPYHLDRSPG